MLLIVFRKEEPSIVNRVRARDSERSCSLKFIKTLFEGNINPQWPLPAPTEVTTILADVFTWF